ncbi:EAL domain-containing protein [Marinomonas rhizomae]|uniref:EAL and modified HD-GYP domain-containing signal transduction protein n=1 Tax=Marinomonas rhizomae TaxID=491948 RepID=A0A366J121_9GAMM|nr:HDOD domain-containing protein [Marinomonas rhizomae]RBP79964.1 EAL and modified HD-GYP domain-containing signal transduction protein [Marinomonas rhizomae]RNF71895.1 EAL domain-containing protein [Marinomonas rhizomae]
MAENSLSAHSNVALARQPIVDSRLAVMGYELLYRNNALATQANVIDEVGATAQVIAASLFELGMENLVGTSKAFINFPRAYLLSPSGMPINKENIVIEVLEDSGFDAVLLSSLRRWVNAGCSIALDDFVFSSKLTPFIELADYIKLDILALGHDDFHKQFEALRGFNVKIIAEKVETWEDYQFCRLLGIEYFQGYFFEKPEMVTSKASKVNSMTLLQLMSSLLNTSVLSIDELERIVSQDAGLVHKLLRYLNSPITGLVASVDSVRLAIMLIGVEKLKSLTNLLLMSEMIGDRHVLLEQIMVRAKHAELFAHRRGYNNQDKYFLAGMLSMIDVCTGMKLGEVLGELPLPNEFINAIVHRSGRVGNTLDLVEHYGNGQAIKNSQDLDDLKKTYLDAIRWADEFLVMV